jgi:hypothetical protein
MAILLGLPTVCLAESVALDDGNIFLNTNDGVLIQLTNSGKDQSPVLSPDGSAVAYLRLLAPPPEPDEDGAYELRIVDVPTRTESVLYRPTSIADALNTYRTNPIGPIVFSPDGDTVYFQRREATTSTEMVALNRRTKELHVVVTGVGGRFWVLKSGQSAGDILAPRRQLHGSGAGFIYPLCLVTPTGREIHKYTDDADANEILQSLEKQMPPN